jgi:hypothetical protein
MRKTKNVKTFGHTSNGELIMQEENMAIELVVGTSMLRKQNEPLFI